MKILEKVSFLFIFAIIFAGSWLSHNKTEIYSTWFAGPHGVLEWLTLAGILSAIIANFYRASILAPFRKTTFLVGLYVAAGIMTVFGALEGFRRWGIVDDFMPGWFVAFLFFLYLVVLPLCYLKFPKVKKRVDNWGIPLPRFYHVVFYLILIITHYSTNALDQRPEQLQFGASWLFFMIMMEPLNRVIFSRTTIER
ncbi:MAG: hypothetical protein COW01_10395 [Bdellovibrionales bacterium CG12_big_fil_rev_8_21_14_0_65_38_15]|nr:MAG: hypothetical protein COW79_07240 [Bdellovibrionales bacterium CG22_combo_CG10-13_8_21_14_all_38_13]PIQ54546.1 MAG: hypothetical protein COW01_10395 [Bdellovibrionales bacterium CG12_big_fil_rev_8_21_14_0_65_38_15]PIR29927.1 MAG: hypothetical protein COV38_08240 [Bdellovibrionales bacterium CG11_big_fil_rev_8_21_14_0_20_38_13]